MRGNFFYKKIGERIIDARRRKMLSQEQLALLSDIDRTYLARIEEGKANPSVKVLHKLTRTMKIKLNTLLRGM